MLQFLIVSLQKWKIAILILKCFISLHGSLNPSVVLKFRDKGVFKSINSVKILNTILSLNFNTTDRFIYCQHQFDLSSPSGQDFPLPIRPRREREMALEMKDKQKKNRRKS